MPQIIPLNADSYDYEFQTVLGGRRLTFRILYNERSAVWTTDILDEDGVALANAVPLVLGCDILENLSLGIGSIFVFDMDSYKSGDGVGTRNIEEDAEYDDTDPLWDNVTLLMHFDGDRVDQKGHSFSGGVNGGTLSTSVKRLGTGSIIFTGYPTATEHQTNALDSSFQFPADFTVEAWLRPTAWDAAFPQRSGAFGAYHLYDGWGLHVNSNTGEMLFRANGTEYSTGITMSLGTWKHVAVVREGTALRFYEDGSLKGSTTCNYNIGSGSTLWFYVGRGDTETTTWWIGAVDEIRITKAARYTTDFVPNRKVTTDSIPLHALQSRDATEDDLGTRVRLIYYAPDEAVE